MNSRAAAALSRIDSGQIRGCDLSCLAHQHRTLDRVLELADVARPPVANQQVIRGRRDRANRLLIALVELREEVIAEQRDVFGPLAQRRHAQRDRVDAEVQVLAQAALTQRHLEVDVGRADQSEIDRDQAIAADRPILALLQHAQQLRLQVRRHLADLVEQQRAALRHLEQPDLVGMPRR